MSLARLAALVGRSASPPGRLAPAEASPAFDAPAALGTAMLQAGLAAAAFPRAGRPVAPPMPGLVTQAQAERPPALTVPSMRASVTMQVEQPGGPLRPPRTDGRVAAAPSAAVAQPAVGAAGMPAAALPAAAASATALVAETFPARAAESPQEQPLARMPASAPYQAVQATIAPSQPAHGAKPAVLDAVVPAPLPALPQPAAQGARVPSGPMPAAPAAPASSPTATEAAEATPTISIGTVEVVIAQKPPRPLPATPARPAPDRGFSRYAAMRSGRDRSW